MERKIRTVHPPVISLGTRVELGPYLTVVLVHHVKGLLNRGSRKIAGIGDEHDLDVAQIELSLQVGYEGYTVAKVPAGRRFTIPGEGNVVETRQVLGNARELGLENRLAGDRAIDLGVTQLANEDRTYRRLVSVGKQLRDDDGADVLVMGCAGMARYRDRLEEVVGLPVIEPTQAAVTLAIGAVLL